jgi:CoA:oxalate CoA-transferase
MGDPLALPSVARPLSGIRVVDFSTMVSGPYCTRLLADCGAEVWKIEPAEGDLIRHAPPVMRDGSRYFAAFNCGKKSVAIDLKTKRGREIAADLAVRADVLVENFRPGVMAQFGLDYDTLSRTSPGIVYCSVSGFGQSGMMAAWPAYAPIVHAMSGFDAAFLGYQKNSSVPPVSGIQIADVLTATFAFGAIQLALVQRLRTGRGDYVDATLLESILALIAGDLQASQVIGGSIPSYSAIRSKDGYLMVVVISEKAFRSLCAALGRSDWLTDPRFAGRAFQRNGAVLMEEVERWTMERSAEECERLLMGAGVPCSRYRSLAEVLGNQHLRERGTFIELRDADGAFLVTNPPFRLKGSDYSSERSVPRLGEHTRQVLLEALGIGEDELERLSAEKAVVA